MELDELGLRMVRAHKLSEAVLGYIVEEGTCHKVDMKTAELDDEGWAHCGPSDGCLYCTMAKAWDEYTHGGS